MNFKSTKLISLILIAGIILSIFTVFISAENTDCSDQNNENRDRTSVIINRTFDEGWDHTNGFAVENKGNKFYIDSETFPDLSRNYFLRVQAETEGDGYAQIYFKDVPENKNHTLVEFDLKVDDYCDLNWVLYGRTKGGMGSGMYVNLLQIKENHLIVLENYGDRFALNNEWIHIACDIDYTGTLENQKTTGSYDFKLNAYITFKNGKILTFSKSYSTYDKNSLYLDFFRFGLSGTNDAYSRKKTSYCIDNLKAYCNNTGFEEIPSDNFGSLVDTSRIKTIPIINNNEISKQDFLKDSLCMKIGVNYVLFKDERKPIYDGNYGGPISTEETVLLPLDIILKYIGYPYFVHEDGNSFDISTGDSISFITVGRKTATVNGTRIELKHEPCYAKSDDGNNSFLVIAMDDVEKLFPGYYVSFDSMGLIVICKKDNVIDRNKNIHEILDIMKKFIFEYKTSEELYSDITATTNNFSHPFMLANQAQFDKLHNAYISNEESADYDKNLNQYICNIINSFEKIYRIYAKPIKSDEINHKYDEYIGIEPDKLPINPYNDSLGYDIGGRLNLASSYSYHIMDLAFAYQITKNEKYLKCMYDLAIQLGEWEHWGPAHFLNCADTSFPYALAIDWTYNAINELSKTNNDYDVNKLIDILYTHGTHQGYYSTIEAPGKTLFPRKQNTISDYTKMTNNWNAVCASGMTMASIITSENDKYRDESMDLLSHTLESLCKNGLEQYAPDGSYVESTVYWSYGTNSLFRLVMALTSSCGSDYGIMNCWGLDKTCYFACHTESSDFNPFNYHDGKIQVQDGYSFFFVSKMLNDPTLASIRMNQLQNGKDIDILDLLFYPDKTEEAKELPLSYFSDGIDAYTARSSWQKGAMFAGIIGGYNYASHGQVDSGSWVYHNLGKIWFCDLGSDEYNVYGYFSNDVRYRYYRMNSEGNNCLVMSSQADTLPYGQNLDSSGKITKYEANEYGSYAIIDNSQVYNSSNNGGKNFVSYARRGMMSTNKGKTVIIQDEVALNNIQTLYWFAHYDLNTVGNIRLSGDKRTAYLNDFEGNTIRASLISKSKEFKFEIMDCYTFVLGGDMGTLDKEYSVSKGGQPEYDRSNFMKLAIKAENVLSFNVAVAIEAVNLKNEQEVGYEWCEMSDWKPSDFKANENENETLLRDFPKFSSIRSGILSMTRLRENGDIYSKNTNSYYRILTDTEYAYIAYKNENISGISKEIETLNKYKKEYDTFVNGANKNISATNGMINSLFGI